MEKTLELRTHNWVVLFNDNSKWTVSRDDYCDITHGEPEVKGGRNALIKEFQELGFITKGELSKPLAAVLTIQYKGSEVTSVVEIERGEDGWRIVDEY